jgi:uncharacterized membrane-anchored protein
MKNLLTSIMLCLSFTITYCQENQDEITKEQEIEYQRVIDSINSSFKYQYGKISLENGIAEIDIPKGYKFLNAEQSKYVLSDLWGNPPSEVLGLLFPEEISPISDDFTYAVEITYSNEGYIDDEDAKDLDYDDLLEEMQDDTNAANPERKKLGYPEIDLVGWASKPFYDDKNKKLHWAKELSFEGEELNTLNYNIRVLGRKGYLNLNAIGTINVLPKFNNDVDEILNSVHFTVGNKYSDFNPDIDEVAAYGIGGLIAGKLLAKAGFFALLLKFWKFIAIGVVGLFSVFKKRIFGSKESEE